MDDKKRLIGTSYSGDNKRRRPGRDKESRMRDLSDDELSGDSDSSSENDKELLLKSSKGKEVKSSKHSSKLKAKEGSSKQRSSDKHKKQKRSKDKRPRDSSESSSCSESENKESRRKEKKLKETLIKRMSDKMKSAVSSNIKVSINRSKYEKLSTPTPKKSSLEFEIEEGPGVPDNIKEKANDLKKDAPQILETLPEASTSFENEEAAKSFEERKEKDAQVKVPDKMLEKSVDKTKDHPELPKGSTSLSENNEVTSKDQPLKSIKVSILRNMYEKSSKADDFESDDVQSSTKEEEEITSKLDKKKDLIDNDCLVVDELKVETGLDIKSQKNRTAELSSSASSSYSSSSDSSPKHSKDNIIKTKPVGKMEEKKEDQSSYNRKLSSRRESSCSTTSDSERDKEKGRGVEKTVKKKDFKRSQGTCISSNSSSSSKSSSSSSSGSSRSSETSSSSSSPKRYHKHSFKRTRRRSRSPLTVRQRSPPRPKKLHVGHLTKTVNKEHLNEIFGTYGTVTNVDLPMDRSNGVTHRGFAYIEFATASEAENAVRCMDGGDLDGQKITVAPVLPFKPRPFASRRISPNRRPFKNWRYPQAYVNRGLNFGGRDRRRPLMRSPPPPRPRRRSRSRSPRRSRHGRRSPS